MIALLEELKNHPPFSFLDETSSRLIESTAQIAYYPNDTVMIDLGDLPQKLYLVIKGAVEARDNDELVDIYHSHDNFGGIELIEKQPSRYQYLVTEELICYEIPKEIFLQLCEKNRDFKTYFFSSIAQRMDIIKEKSEYDSTSDLMVARIDRSILRQGCIVLADMPIIEALKKMDAAKASSLLVENSDGYGIVTDADFRHYILHSESEELLRIAQLQTYPIISITEGELLFNVLLLMTEKNIKHLPVVSDSGELLGVLELISLLSYFSNQSHLITVEMEKAQSLEEVIDAAQRLEVMVGVLQAKGVKTRYIAKLVAQINTKMYRKLFEMIIPPSWHDKTALVLLGSEGRSEQILRTDQDNALIFQEGFMPEDIKVVTTSFIEALDEIGFPRCEGNVMIINDKWCKSMHAYKKDIDSWIEEPGYEGFMDMAIFYDSVAVAGVTKLHEELQSYLIESVKQKQSILPHFARAIESFDSPLGMFSRFVTGSHTHKNEIDIKKGALFALVHGVRALALEHGVTVTNTTLRIKALHMTGLINKEDAMELIGAQEVLNSLRLHSQLLQAEKGQVINNYISITGLSKLERDILKEALKSVNKFKKMVSYHFHLSMVG